MRMQDQRMSRTDWAIAVAIALPISVSLLLSGLLIWLS
jgi:hypothetical protein